MGDPNPKRPSMRRHVQAASLLMAILVCAPALAGHAGPPATPGHGQGHGHGPPWWAGPWHNSGPVVVIASSDEGFNPYHEQFRDPSPLGLQHPSTYIPGYPSDARSVNITFNHASVRDAIRADCLEWAKVEVGRLYWFPGTRIVGALSLDGRAPLGTLPPEPLTCPTDRVPSRIYGGWHGTMTASRAIGRDVGACAECRLVAIQNSGSEGVAWATTQPWIDIMTKQDGTLLPVARGPDDNPTGDVYVMTGAQVAAHETMARSRPFFHAATNGVLGITGGVGHPSWTWPFLTPSVITVGGHDSGHVVAYTGGSPHLVADACMSWAAMPDSFNATTEWRGGGASAAAAWAAGSAGKVLLEAKRILHDALGPPSHAAPAGEVVLARGRMGMATGPLADGILTHEEFRRLILATADKRPDAVWQDGPPCTPENLARVIAQDPLARPVQYTSRTPLPILWRDVPEEHPMMYLVGYGALTPSTFQHARLVLLGEAAMPARPAEDAYFVHDDALRRAAYAANTAV